MIKLLDKSVYELIAAGEVIERPASVIKELVENSVDAGAKRVTVEIKNGGITYMRVTDDGCGMAYEEVPTAFLRHATSKLSKASELDNITTLGFRGEALASVAAVTKTEVLTKRAEDELGTVYKTEGGEETLYEETGCPDGTTIIMRDLFFNTPARLKFLKKDSTEANYVQSVVDKLALSYPGVAFSFIRDNKTVRVTAGDGKLYSVIYSVFGKQFAAALTEVDHSCNGISVSGYITTPYACRANRQMQYFFINGRSVRNTTCMAALEEGYKNSVMVGKFPACVLNIEMPAGDVDVNVSPSKTEVRFANEKVIFETVYLAVKNGILNAENGKEAVFPSNTPKSSEQTAPFSGISDLRGTSDNFPKKNGSDLSLSKIYGKETERSKSEKMPQLQSPKAIYKPLPPKNVFIQEVFGEDRNFLDRENKPDSSDLSDTSASKKAVGIISDSEKTADMTNRSGSEKTADMPYMSDLTNTVCAPDISVPTNTRDISDTFNASDSSDSRAQSSNVIPDGIGDVSSFIRPDSEEEKKLRTPDPIIEEKYKPELKFIGELFKTYIVCECGDELILMDKHAAHERIRFDELKKGLCVSGQLLAEPVKLSLSLEETTALADNADYLENLGIDLYFRSETEAEIMSFPTMLEGEPPEAVLQRIAAVLLKGGDNIEGLLFDDILHTAACKGAIKANEPTSAKELEMLAKRVWEDSSVRYCPHGRPIINKMSKYNIERSFGRIQ